jgi:hypothetical protein
MIWRVLPLVKTNCVFQKQYINTEILTTEIGVSNEAKNVKSKIKIVHFDG